MYEVGTLYEWPDSLPHAPHAWPHLEWDSSAIRATVQAFGVRCGDMWYFNH